MNPLLLLLQNLFNAEGFVSPSMEMIQDSKDLDKIEEEEQIDMARTILSENEDLRGGTWYGTYLSPLGKELNLISM